MKKVFTFMCLDLPHAGHVNFLKECRKLGDYLVVGVLTDEVIESYKKRPIMKFEERFTMAQSIRWIDEVVRQDVLDPTPLLKKYDPDVICHGDDWNHIPGSEYMMERGKEVKFVKYYPHQSTSKIIEEILGRHK